MEIVKQIEDQKLTLKLIGRLDTNTSGLLETEINGLSNITYLVLDFKELDYVSSAGLRVLLAAQKKMNNLGSMDLINVNDDINEVLEMTGFSSILNIVK